MSTPITAVPLVLAIMAAAVESLRVPLLLVLAIAFVAAVSHSWRVGRAPGDLAFLFGACALVALAAAWTGVQLPSTARDGTTCTEPAAPFAAYRAAGGLVVLSAAVLIVRLTGSRPASIGLRSPSRRDVGIATAALVVVGLVATVIGPALAEPFFGPLPIRLRAPALIPALLFAIANAAMEETAYRGALLRAAARWHGLAVGMAVQAAAFGLAHGVGGEVVGSPLPVVTATAVGGLVFGALALRTQSLLLPIALHAALDIPIYYANACLFH